MDKFQIADLDLVHSSNHYNYPYSEPKSHVEVPVVQPVGLHISVPF